MSSVDTRSGATPGLRRRKCWQGWRGRRRADHPSGTCRDAGREEEAVDDISLPASSARRLCLVVPEANTLAHIPLANLGPLQRGPSAAAPPPRLGLCLRRGRLPPLFFFFIPAAPGLPARRGISANAALRSRPHHLRVSQRAVINVNVV